MSVIGETSPLRLDSLQVTVGVTVAIPALGFARKALESSPKKWPPANIDRV